MMNPSSPSNKTGSHDNVQRTVERDALRRIRNVLDTMEREEHHDRRFRLGVYAVCGVLVLLLILIVAMLVLR